MTSSRPAPRATGLAKASLTLGILSLFPGLCFGPGNWLVALPGVFCGVAALRPNRRANGPQDDLRLARAGLLCSLLAALVSLTATLVFFAAGGPQAFIDLIADVATALSG